MKNNEAFSPDNFERGVQLAAFTTMMTGGEAELFYRLKNKKELPGLVKWSKENGKLLTILGEGSNAIFSSRGIKGIILKMEIAGLTVLNETDTAVEVEVGGGEDWDQFAETCVNRQWWGAENMSRIPGTIGALPVQNVGAYGQSANNIILSVEAYDTQKECFVSLDNKDCNFGHRCSIFNREQSGRYIIFSVKFKLSKEPTPILTRKNLREALQAASEKDQTEGTLPEQSCISLELIRSTIINMREDGSKLPAPDTVGSSGTFFQAKMIPKKDCKSLITKNLKQMRFLSAAAILYCRFFSQSKHNFRISPAILFPLCKVKQFSEGSFQLYKNNCSVLVNSQAKSNTDLLLKLVKNIRRKVAQKTSVEINVEPVFIGFSNEDLKGIYDSPLT